jgi:purine-binding chemotaxis protein CheW
MENELEIVSFTLDGKLFAIPTSTVLQLVRAVLIQPDCPERINIEGLINFQGTIIPMLDLRALLKFSPKVLAPSDFILIMAVFDMKFGVRADAIDQVFNFQDSLIQKMDSLPVMGLIQIEQKIIHVLDAHHLAQQCHPRSEQVAHAS